jgi:hypothetical protein
MQMDFGLLQEYLSSNRTTLIERCRLKAAQRSAWNTTDEHLAYGIPVFLEQIIKALQAERTSDPMRSRRTSGPSGGAISAMSEIGATARRHGHELLQHDYTVDRVVHDYGDLCQAITDIAFEDNVPIQVDEFRTLNCCIDNAIADCVTEFAYERELLVADREADALHQRLSIFVQELHDLITTATHAVTAIRTGQVGVTGPTGGALDRCLVGLRNLVDRSIANGGLEAAIPVRRRLVGVADLIADIGASATLEAQSCGCVFTVSPVDPHLAVHADRGMLFSAVRNLLQNAFKFTRYRTEVSLNAYATADRVRIDVEDSCGGLPVGDTEHLFQRFTQNDQNNSRVGLGLSICRRCVEANDGVVSVHDEPGIGCVFTIELPRHLLGEKVFRD